MRRDRERGGKMLEQWSTSTPIWVSVTFSLEWTRADRVTEHQRKGKRDAFLSLGITSPGFFSRGHWSL